MFNIAIISTDNILLFSIVMLVSMRSCISCPCVYMCLCRMSEGNLKDHGNEYNRRIAFIIIFLSFSYWFYVKCFPLWHILSVMPDLEVFSNGTWKKLARRCFLQNDCIHCWWTARPVMLNPSWRRSNEIIERFLKST